MIVGTAGIVTALALAGSGNAAVLLAADNPSPGITAWLQGGGSAAAVAGLVYVARMVVKGDLVPRAVADRENETAAAIRVAAENARHLQDLLDDGRRREKTLADISGETVKAMADVSSELRWWRDQREKGRTVSLPRRSEQDPS